MELRALAAALVLLAPVVCAQRAPKPDQLEEELDKKQRKLAEVDNRLQRLHELRVRLDLGLPVDAERYFALDGEQRELVQAGGAERLAAEAAEAQRLAGEAVALAEQLDRAQKALPEPRLTGGDPPPVPIAQQPAHEAPPIVPIPLPVATHGTEHAEQAPPAPSAEPPPQEHSLVIAGSVDHSAVGRVLLRSGEQLLRDAGAATDPAAAQALRERATRALNAAKRELDALSRAHEPALIDLYHLARTEEKLGNLAAADSLYAQIISRDQTDLPDGTQQLGKWGRAARAAKSVLRWLSDTGGWKPARAIESITWDDQ